MTQRRSWWRFAPLGISLSSSSEETVSSPSSSLEKKSWKVSGKSGKVSTGGSVIIVTPPAPRSPLYWLIASDSARSGVFPPHPAPPAPPTHYPTLVNLTYAPSKVNIGLCIVSALNPTSLCLIYFASFITSFFYSKTTAKQYNKSLYKPILPCSRFMIKRMF